MTKTEVNEDDFHILAPFALANPAITRYNSTEHRAQSTEHRAQSTEHRAQSTEHRAQSHNYSLISFSKEIFFSFLNFSVPVRGAAFSENAGIKAKITRYWIALATFALLMLRFGSNIPEPHRLTDLGTVGNLGMFMPYVVSYRFGLGSRFLVGSVLHFFVDFISVEVVWLVAISATTLLLALISFLVGQVISSKSGKERAALLALLVLWLVSPLSTQFLEITTFGRMELFHQILMLLAILCLCSKRRLLLFFIPILTVACVAIHHVFVFLYFAPLLVILFYHFAQENDAKMRRAYAAVLLLTFTLTSAAFCVFQFGKTLNVDTPIEMNAIITSYSDIDYYPEGVSADSLTPIFVEYFTTIKWHLQHYIIDGYKYALLGGRFVLILIFFSPLILFFIVFWRKCIKAESRNLIKWVYRGALLSPFAAIPAFCLTVDYGRWVAAIFFMQFVLMYYFSERKEKAAQSALTAIYDFVYPQKVTVYFAALLYFTCLGNIHCYGVLNIMSIIGSVLTGRL
jgi:hypothetical protein